MRAEWDNHPAQAYITLKTTIFHRQTGVDAIFTSGNGYREKKRKMLHCQLSYATSVSVQEKNWVLSLSRSRRC